MKMLLAAAAMAITGAAAAQTPAATPDPAPVEAPAPTGSAPAGTAPATPAPTATSPVDPSPTEQALPRCSASVRDRCLQDERFARDTPNPGGSRDNNAMHYANEPAARAVQRRAAIKPR